VRLLRSGITKWLIVSFGCLLLLLLGLLIWLHTSSGREVVWNLLQEQALSRGKVYLQCGEFDFNLAAGTASFRDLTFRLADRRLPPIVFIPKATVHWPPLDLLSLSFHRAQITLDSPRIYLLTLKDGSSNWRTVREKEPALLSGEIPSKGLKIAGLTLEWEDRQENFSLFWPGVDLDLAKIPGSPNHQVNLESRAAGRLRWRESDLKLLKINLRGKARLDQAEVERLQMETEAGNLSLEGKWASSLDSPLEARGRATLEGEKLVRLFLPGWKLGGRICLEATLAGPSADLHLAGRLEGQDLTWSRRPLGRLTAEADWDMAKKDLELRRLEASFRPGKLSARGIWHLGIPREESQLSLRFAGLQGGSLQALGMNLPVLPLKGNGEVKLHWPGSSWKRLQGEGTLNLTPLSSLNPSRPEWSAHFALRDQGSGGKILELERAALPGFSARGIIRVHPDLALEGEIRSRLESWRQLAVGLEPLFGQAAGNWRPMECEGQADLRIQLSGHLADPSASIELEQGEISFPKYPPISIQARARADRHRIRVEEMQAHWQGQELQAHGEIDMTAATPSLELEATAPILQVAELMKPWVSSSSLRGEADLRLSASGPLASPRVHMHLHGQKLEFQNEPLGSLRVDADYAGQAISLGRVELIKLAKKGEAHIGVNGRLDLEEGRYSFELSGKEFPLDHLELFGQKTLSGIANLQASGRGTLASPELQLQLELQDTTLSGRQLGTIQTAASLVGEAFHGELQIPRYDLKGTITGSARPESPLHFRMEAKSLPLARLSVALPGGRALEGEIQGLLEGTVNLSSPLDLEASWKIPRLEIRSGTFKVQNSQPIEISCSHRTLRVRSFQLISGQSHFQMSGELPLERTAQPGQLQASGQLNDAWWNALFPEKATFRVRGKTTLEAILEGAGDRLRFNSNSRWEEGRLEAAGVWQAPLSSSSISWIMDENGPRQFSARGKMGDGDFQASGAFPAGFWRRNASALSNQVNTKQTSGEEEPASFSLGIANLSYLLAQPGQAPLNGRLSLALEGSANGPSLEKTSARMEVSQFTLTGNNFSLAPEAPLRLALSEKTLQLTDVRFREGDSRLAISGQMGITSESPVSVDVAGRFNTALLSILHPKIQSAGWFDLNVHLRGSLSHPELAGSATCEKVSLSLDAPPVSVENLKARIELEPSRIRLSDLSGRLNGGELKGSGQLQLGKPGETGYALDLEGKGVYLHFPEGLETLSDVRVLIRPSGKNLSLQAQVDVQAGIYQKDIDFLGRGLVTNRGITLPAAEKGGGWLLLDVQLHSSNPLKVQNNVADLLAHADIKVGGTLARPEVSGNLRLEEGGRLFFGDKIYTINRGIIRQERLPQLNPYLDLQGNTPVGEYTVTLKLNGQIHRLSASFTSEPSLPEDDVVSLLLTGKTQAESRKAKIDIKQAQSMILLSGALSTDLSAKLRRYVGISQVSIQPGQVAAESDPGARLTLTQYFTRTFRLVYSTNLSDTSKQIWMTEYNLSRRFNARVVKEEDNSYRSEFRHQVRFGGIPSTGASGRKGGLPRTRATGVEFAGNIRFPAADLLKRYGIQPGREYDQNKFFQNLGRLEQFYRSQGYQESRVRLHLERQQQGVLLQVTIAEGSPVKFVFEGDSPSGRMKRLLANKWPAAFNDPQRIRMSTSALKEELGNQGYLDAQIDAKIIRDEEAGKEVLFTLQRGPQYKRGRISLEGASRSILPELMMILSSPQIQRTLLSAPADAVRPLTRYYQLQGYLAAEIETPVLEKSQARQQVDVRIRIREGVPYRIGKLEVSGNQAFAGNTLLEELALKENGKFQPGLLENALGALESKYRDAGYLDARIESRAIREDSAGLVHLKFLIEEGKQHRIARMEITGNERVSTQDIKKQLQFREGEARSATQSEQTLRKLYQSGAFENVEIQTRPLVSDSAVPANTLPMEVQVVVKEPRPYRVTYGGLYDSSSGPGVIFDFENMNWLGFGRTLGSRTRLERDYQEQRLYFTQPFFRSHLLHTTAAIYTKRELELEEYRVLTNGVSLQQELPLGGSLYFSYGYKFENAFVEALHSSERLAVNSAPLTASLSRDTRNDFLDARRGSFTTHSLEFAPAFLGSSYGYSRYFGQYSKYFPLTRARLDPIRLTPLPARLVFATQGRIGLLKPFSSEGIALTDRFFAGGGTSIRGFAQDSVGPKNEEGTPTGGEALFILNNELRFPLYRLFEGVGFVDMGNVYAKVADIDLGDLRKSAGFGLRLKIPFFMLRFDYGFILNRRPGEPRGGFFFSIGQAF
jgi:outer membrane protein assembly complex protein YaeT